MKLLYRRKWIFIILPLFYLILSLIFLGGIKQFYISHLDPAYAYLLNGTNLASGYFRVGIIEHPGTPIEIFAAIIIFIKHLFTGTTLLYQDVLLHPESYLYTCSAVLALLLSFATYFAGSYVYRYSGNLLLSILFQVSPLFYDEIIRRTIVLSAESSITIVGVLFMAYFYSNTTLSNQARDKSTTNKSVILFGLFTALLFTTKIYCFPLILLILFMIKQATQRILYLVSSSTFSLILLCPLYNQFRNWAGWVKSMVFHSGPYGKGNSGVINSVIYKNNLIEIFATHYIFVFLYFVIIAAFLISLWWKLKKRGESSGLIFPITGILIFFTLFMLIVAKQYKFDCPNPLTHKIFTITNFYYFILPITCFPLVFIVCYKILVPLIPFQFIRLYKQPLLSSVLVIFIALGMLQTYKACYGARSDNVSFEKTRSFIDEWKNTPLIIVSNGGDQVSEQAALFIGTVYSGRWDMPRYFNFLKKIYPATYLYIIGWRDAVTFWGSETNISTVLEKNNEALVYISGADSLAEQTTLRRICEEKPQKDQITYKNIYSSENKYENIYFVSKDSATNYK